MSVIAPFEGEVLYVESQPGDVVEAGTSAVNIANLDHLYVETQVDESDIASVKVGNQVSATVDAVPGVTLTGKVAAINPVGEVVSGLVKYTVRVDLDKADKDLSLPLGATVNTTIQVKEPTATLAVPVTAIQNDNKGEYVWVVRNDSAVRVDVVGGQIVGDMVAVTGDLKEGEIVEVGQKNNTTVRMGPFGRGN
jgi:RND family efflux transporter MFP subunit